MGKEIIYNGETRFKKASLNNFATKWQKLDVRGKSSKELKDIILELQKVNRYMLRSIKALGYKEGEAKKKITQIKRESASESNKLVRRIKTRERLMYRDQERKSLREAKIESDKKIKDLTTLVSKLMSEKYKLLANIESLNAKVVVNPTPAENNPSQYLIDQVNVWKGKHDEARAEARKNLRMRQKVKTVTKTVVKEVERKLSVEDIQARKFLSYIQIPIPQRVLNYSEVALKVASFIDANNLYSSDLSVIVKADMIGNFTVKDIGLSSRKLQSLASKGYLSYSSTGINTREHYWFITPAGKELVKKLMNHISYGKTGL